MHLGSTMAAVAVAAMVGTGIAQAAPMMALQPAVDAGPAPQLELVRGGCGWGAHRTWRGYCHLNYGWRGRVRAWRRWGWHRW